MTIAEIWNDDLLDRRADADFIVGFLRNRIAERIDQGATGSYVLNLDAGWGQGKTFFLTRLSEQLQEGRHVAVYVNAWRDDHADDPMLAVMSAIDGAISPFLKKKRALSTAWNVTKTAGVTIAISAAKHSARTLGKRVIGGGIEEIEGLVAQASNSESPIAGESLDKARDAAELEVNALVDHVAEKALKRFREDQTAIGKFRVQLQRFLIDAENKTSIKLPLFILIDELDRCRPTYAIKLLERVKHLFEVPNVAFLIATDSVQLRHSIKAVYGDSFDSAAYLRRFFDRTYRFEPAAIENFVSEEISRTRFPLEKFDIPKFNAIEKFLINGAKFFNLNLRDVSQCIDIAHTVGTVWNYPVKIQFCYLFPLIVCFQQNNNQLWDTIIDGSDSDVERISDGRSDWSLTFVDRTSRDGRSGIKVFRFVSTIARYIRIDLFKSTNNEATSQPGRLIQDIFVDELHRIHRGVVQGNPPMSIMTRYPEFIRNAGRVIIEDGLDNEARRAE